MPNSLSELTSNSFSPSRGSVVNNNIPDPHQNTRPSTPPPPVRWLQSLTTYGVILCTEHQTCYTPGKNLKEHLKRKHSITRERAKSIEEWVAAQNVAIEVTNPPDNSPLIHGLQFFEGYVCTATDACKYRVASQEKIQRHCSREHGVDTRRKQKERLMYRKVILQHFFAKAKVEDYWVVQQAPAIHGSETNSGATGTENPESSLSTSAAGSGSGRLSQPLRPNISQAILSRVENAVQRNEARYQQIGEPNHVSEISPWLRKSRFHHHISGVDAEAVAASHKTPKSQQDDPRLWEICMSVERVMTKAYELVPELLHVDAKVLNTFQSGTTSQDPFQALQNQLSFQKYVAVFQALLCYYIRVWEGHFISMYKSLLPRRIN